MSDTWYFYGRQKVLLKKYLKNDSIENLYLKALYYNEEDEEIVFRYHLIVKQRKKFLKDANGYSMKRYNEINTQEEKFNLSKKYLRQSENINLNFLFNMSTPFLKKCFNNKSFIMNGEKIFVNYIRDLKANDNLVVISNSSQSMQIELESKRVFIMNPYPVHYIIGLNNIIYYDEKIEHYQVISLFSNFLHQLYLNC